MISTRFLFLLTSLILMASSVFASKQLVLKIVGSVESQVITNRDVEASFIIDRALYNEGAFTTISYGTEEFSNALNRLLIEWMVRDEATTFGVATVSAAEVDQSFASVKQKIAGSGTIKTKWAALGFTDSQLKEMVARKLRANRFIKYKSNSSYVQVSDEEARDYFNKNRLKFGTMEFDNFKGSIKRFLEKKNAEERLRDWLAILRKKHNVKNLIGSNTYDGPPEVR